MSAENGTQEGPPLRHTAKVEDQVEVEQQMTLVKRDWLHAEVEGNLRIPQNFLGIFILVGDTVLREQKPDFASFAQSELSPAQVGELRSIMQAAHTAKGIPAGDQTFLEKITQIADAERRTVLHQKQVSDEQLRNLWDYAKNVSIQAIAQCWNAVFAAFPSLAEEVVGFDQDYKVIAARLQARLERYTDGRFLSHLRGMFDAATTALRSPEGQRLAAQYRGTFDYKKRDIPSGVDIEIEMVQLRKKSLLSIRTLVWHQMRERNPEIAHKITEDLWVNFG